jgi:hypothetical protein
MPIISKDSQTLAQQKVIWSIQDTEWLLRLITDAQISGRDIEQAAITITKIKHIHSELLNKGV